MVKLHDKPGAFTAVVVMHRLGDDETNDGLGIPDLDEQPR